MVTVLGIDEAGRGPIIGPLIICGVVCKEGNLQKLKEIGVKDSKLLTPIKREKLVPLIKNIIVDFSLIKILPQTIERENLNEIELRATASLIQKFMPQKVIFDTPVPTKRSDSYCNKIKSLVPNKDIEIIGEPHADTNYPIVGAASILAKVERDHEIIELHKKYGDFGSGYLGDPKTQQFIKEWNRYPEIIRRNWDTCKETLVTPGKVIVIGDRDTGKTEFCKSLVNIGLKKSYKVGILDLDVGQSHIGPPGSLGFGIATKKIKNLSQIPATIVYPIWKLSPSGVTEHIITGLKILLTKIPSDVNFIVIDTTGYIRTQEAIELKIRKIESINPDHIVFLEHNTELEHLATMFPREKIFRFPVSRKAEKKSPSKRKRMREKYCLLSSDKFVF